MLEDGLQDSDADRNLVRLVSVLRQLQQAGALRGELNTLVGQLDAASDSAGVRQTLKSLLPDVVRTHAVRERQVLSLPNRAIVSRRAPSGTGASTLNWGVLNATSQQPEQPSRTLWLDLQTEDAQQDDTGGFDGFDASGRGLTLGVGFDLSDDWYLGLSAGTHTADVDTDFFGDDDIDLDDYAVTLSYTRGVHSLSVGYARTTTTTDRERLLVINTDTGRRIIPLQSDIDADQDSWLLGYSALMSGDGVFSWSPSISLGRSTLRTDDYTERGPNSVAFAVETDDATQVVGSVGVDASWFLSRGAWTFIPSAGVALEHDFKAEATETLSRFRNTALTFVTEGYSIEENRWRLHAGLTAYYYDAFSVGLSHQAQRKNDYHFNATTLSLQVRF